MAQQERRELAVLLGMPFDVLDMDEAVRRIDDFVQSGEPHFVATANVNFVAMAYRDPEFMDVVRRADMITADGMPIVWASRLLGAPLPERVTGADLVPRLVKLAADKNYTVFFLGGQEAVGKEAVRRLTAQYPGLRAYHYSPEFGPLLDMANDKILAEVRSRRPQMLFVSLGAGKAEKWIRMNLARLDVPVSIGVGATIDFLAGRVSRSPVFMQRLGLEWLYRLLMEPGRLARRYFMDFFALAGILVPQALHHALARKGRRGGLGARPETEADVLAVSGRLDALAGGALQEKGLAAFAERLSLVVDLGAAAFVDSSGMGALVVLEKKARESGLSLILAGAPPQVRRTLELAKLHEFFRLAPDVAAALEELRGGAGAARVEPGPATAQGVPLALSGRIDALTASRMKESLFAAAQELGPGQALILDLGGLEFIDSTGLSVLILLRKKLAVGGAGLELRNLPDAVRTMFRVARMDRFFGLEKETGK